MATTKVHYGVHVIDLIKAGIVNPGDEATFEPRRGEVYKGRVEANGDLTLDGRRFDTPSAAAETLARASGQSPKDSRNGWTGIKVGGRPLKEYRDQFLARKHAPPAPSVPSPAVPPGVSQPSTAPPAEVQSGGFPPEIRSELRSLVQEIKALAASDSGHRPSEADTRALFIDRYLRLLGYVGFEDTRREYFIKNLKEYIDYLLYVDGVPAIAVEAKALGNDLTEPMAAQLIKYAAIEGIEWCVLTNGRQVFVYNQYLKGPVPDKLVLKLDLLVADAGQNLDQTIARLWLLSKESMRANALTSYMDQVRLDRSIREVLLEPGSAATGALKSSLLERFGLRVSEDAITGWLREHLGGV